VKTLKFWPAEKLEALIAEAPDKGEEPEETAEEPRQMNSEETSGQTPSPRKGTVRMNRPVRHDPRVDETSEQPQLQVQHDPSPIRRKSPENAWASKETDPMRVRFFDDLAEVKDALGLKFPERPRVGSRTVDLYDLVGAIEMQGGNEAAWEAVDFIRVAEAIGYNKAEAPRVAGLLDDFYHTNLAKVISGMEELPGSESEGNEDEDQFCTPDQGISSVQPPGDVGSPQSFIPSSPTEALQRSKRTMETAEIPSSDQRKKRRRLSCSSEIPSTPPEKVGIMTQVPAGHTPHSAYEDVFEDVFEDATQGQLPELPQEAEEEEEDTIVVPATQVEGQDQRRSSAARFMSEQNSFDVTASQQLHLESDDIPPTDPGRRERETSSSDDDVHTARSGPQSPELVEARSGTLAVSNTSDSRGGPTEQANPIKKRYLHHSFSAGSRKLLAPVGRQPPSRDKQQPESSKPAGDASRSTQTRDNQAEILSCIETYEALGYAHDIVIEALKRTTMTPGGLAAHVMQSLQNKEGVPPNCEGVWTDRDDRGLLMVSSSGLLGETSSSDKGSGQSRRVKREWDRLVDKHGLERIELRKMFLDVDGGR
jgi:hypothetical protein